MGLKIEETFQVQAPASRVWEFLVDPHQVVQCLPGAELVEAQDENTFVGRVKVKVGPVTASYKGKATFMERDDANRRVRMVGSGQETGGSGSAKMTMTSEVVELPDGTSEVRVHAELDVVGRIVQFGRGMIEEVNRQLFRQFTECTRARLETEAAAEPEAPEAAADAGPIAEPEAPPAGAPTAEAGEAVAGLTAVGDTGAAGSGPGAALNTVSGTSPPPGTTPRQSSRSRTTSSHPSAGRPAASAQPVRALPLVLRALWAMIRRFFGRLFGRGKK